MLSGNVLMQHHLSRRIKNTDIHGSGIKIDTTI